MTITTEHLRATYARLNDLMFAGQLPQVELRISSARTFLGNCRCTTSRLPDGRIVRTGIIMQISRSFDLSEAEIDSVVAHEMLHVFIMANNLPDTGPHGEIFRALMHNMNREYGLNITVRGNVPPERKTPADEKPRIVARLKMADGSTSLKVLPRVAATIRKFRHDVLRTGQVKKCELFVSVNPLFGRFPSSGSLRVYPIDAAMLETALDGATALTQL